MIWINTENFLVKHWWKVLGGLVIVFIGLSVLHAVGILPTARRPTAESVANWTSVSGNTMVSQGLPVPSAESSVTTATVTPTPSPASTPKSTATSITPTNTPTSTSPTTQTETPTRTNPTPTSTATTSPTPTLTPTPTPSPTPDTSLELKNLGVSFDGTNETGGPGDFYFTNSLSKPFLEYGAQVSDPQGNPKHLYEFTYFVLSNTNVISVIDGVVTRIEYQGETGDYEIDIKPNTNSVWIVNYDHVTNITVNLYDTVNAGYTIGKPQPYGGYGRIELALLTGGNNGSLPYRYCPLYGFSSSLKSSFASKVASLMSSWETYKGDTSIYNESGFAYASGCTTEYVSE